MAYDNTQLVADVLSELQALGGGQSVAAEDSDIILGRLDGILATLATRNIIALTSDAIDDDAYDWLVKYVAEIVAPKFGRPTDELARLNAENMLRTVYRAPRSMTATLRMDAGLSARTRRARPF